MQKKTSISCEVPFHTDLKNKLLTTKSTRAVVADGWRIDGLKQSPGEWHDLLATVLNEIAANPMFLGVK